MKKQQASERFSVLLAICDDEYEKQFEEYLAKKNLNKGIIFRGKGTAESEIADIFGFGLSDKMVTALLVKESQQDKILKSVTNILGIEKDTYGLAMLLGVSSASSTMLDLMGINII
jgi:hypothetical protein